MPPGEKTPPIDTSASSCTLTVVVAARAAGGPPSASNANIEAATGAAARIKILLTMSNLPWRASALPSIQPYVAGPRRDSYRVSPMLGRPVVPIHSASLVESTEGVVRVRKAVVLAAGYGTRMLPATKAQPKESLPLVDHPVAFDRGVFPIGLDEKRHGVILVYLSDACFALKKSWFRGVLRKLSCRLRAGSAESRFY